MYPLEEFNKLSKKEQTLIEKAENDNEKQFEVGQYLIEGKHNFPIFINLGLRYIENSVNQKCTNAIIYYIKLLIKGKIIPENLSKAKEYLSKLNAIDDSRKLLFHGLLNYKKGRFKKAAKYFEEGSKLGNSLCMYKYGKMLFIGEGTKKNNKEAIKYFSKSKELGYAKSGYFLESLNSINRIKKISKLPPETQMIFITNNIKNIETCQKSEFSQLVLKHDQTEQSFFNKSLKSSIFYECLNLYKNISIEIEYPSETFKSIIDLIIKIRNKNLKQMNIGIVFSSFSEPFPMKCFSNDILYHRINSHIHAIPSEAFKECLLLTQIMIPSSVAEIGTLAFSGCSSLTQIAIPSSLDAKIIGLNSNVKIV